MAVEGHGARSRERAHRLVGIDERDRGAPAIVRRAVSDSDEPPISESWPPSTVVAPVKVFVPDRTSVPPPVFVSAPVPETIPDTVSV